MRNWSIHFLEACFCYSLLCVDLAHFLLHLFLMLQFASFVHEIFSHCVGYYISISQEYIWPQKNRKPKYGLKKQLILLTQQKSPNVSSCRCGFSSMVIAGEVSLLLFLVALSSKDAQCRSSPKSAFEQEGERDKEVVIPVSGMQKSSSGELAHSLLNQPELCHVTIFKRQGRQQGERRRMSQVSQAVLSAHLACSKAIDLCLWIFQQLAY